MPGMHPLRLPLLVVAAMLAATSVHATTVDIGHPAASQPPAGNWATREQLHACLDLEASLKERSRAIDAANAVHQKMYDDVQAEGARLQAAQEELDHGSSSAVKRFNKLAQEHNQHVQRLNQDAADGLPATNAYNDDRTAYNAKCGGRTYRAEDLEAETKKRKRATAASGV